MNWHCVRVPGRRSAIAWMALARSVHEDAGFPPGCSIHYDEAPGGEGRLYFSPECAAVFAQLLKLLGARPCAEPRETEDLIQVLRLPARPMQAPAGARLPAH